MAAKILTVAQQKGGAGKTTLAAQLAAAWTQEGRRVAILDIDPQASLAGWFEAREEHATEPDPLTLNKVGGWRISQSLDDMRKDFDIIVIDSPPHAETEARIAVRAAHLVLVPIQPSPMDLWATQETVDLAKKEKRRLLVVLNRVPPRGRAADVIRAQLAARKLPTAAATIGNRIAFVASMLEGKGVVETESRSQAAEEIRALAGEVAEKLGI
ncbi:MAG: ParA family protein [Hyphomicrobiales bacterium]|nr:ParA family protein [Hyphomicrobiales bacterium]